MQGIHTYMPETNRVSRIHSVAAIPRLLFTVHYYYYYYYYSRCDGKKLTICSSELQFYLSFHVKRKLNSRPKGGIQLDNVTGQSA
jgi:hypothetical protein